MRFKLLLLLFIYAGLVDADWTGIAVEFADVESDWKFDSDERRAQSSGISFQIEEKTATDLSVGAGIGYTSLRVIAESSDDTKKFDTQYFQIYLRQQIRASESISLHGKLNFRYNSGRNNDKTNRAEVDWSETSFEIGASVRFSNFRITPFAALYDIDGDISDDSGTEVFEIDDPMNRGIRFDYYVEDTAFVRLEIQSGGQAGGLLTFARRY